MNLPNKLTIARMIITPIFLAAITITFPHNYLVAAIIFAIASITDALDGRLARKNDQVTVFGKLLDPVADKMLTTAAMLALMQLGLCSIWVVMIVLTREFAVTSIRLVASAQGVVIPANMWGKVKTACQMTFVIVIMLLCEAQETFALFDKVGFISLNTLSNTLMWVTAVLTVVSGLTYIAASRKIIDFKK